MRKENSRFTKILIMYYGLLQSLHLLILIRAGVILKTELLFPFPILPPPGGWQPQALPFMFGLAGTDLIGIILGIFFAYQSIFKGIFNPLSGLLSLTIFITSAIVFAAGTFPSGAWAAHPVAYGTMVFLFVPVVPLYLNLFKHKVLST